MNSSITVGNMHSSYLDSSSVYEIPNSKSSRSLMQTQVKSKAKFTWTTQTGKNVSKVRWLVDDSYFNLPDSFATEYFVSGSSSWLDEENEVSVWKLSVSPNQKGEKEADVNLISKAAIRGSVTGMSSLSSDRFCICTSDGALFMYKCHKDEDDNIVSFNQTCCQQLFNLSKGKKSPATAVVAKDDAIVTVGEDGSIYECRAAGLGVLRRLEKVDPLSISSVSFISRNEVMTGNGGGQLKVWDLRSSSNEPTQIMNPNVVMNNLYGAISICQHPSQTHAVIVGYQSGCMDLWDLRLGPNSDPIANLASEGGSLSEIYFHQVNPDHFFSCAQSGQVCHWYPAERSSNPSQVPIEYSTDLNLEFLKRGLVFKDIHTSLFPVNSMNISNNDRIVIGSDSGVIFCTEIRV